MFIKAHVISMHHQPAPAGHRLYAVFETAEQDVLGIWMSVQSQDLLHVGDQVWLDRDRFGRLRLALKPLPCAVQLGLFGWLNRMILRSRPAHPSSPSLVGSQPTPLHQDSR